MANLLFFTLCSILIVATAVENITVTQNITDEGNRTIDSPGGVFQLGFFSPGSSKNRYIGIWYMKIFPKTFVWVANRENPLTDTSGVLSLDVNGSLVISDGTGSIIWSSNSSRSVVDGATVAQLFDDGNFVIKKREDGDPEKYFWQSFDHPVDHILPTQKFGHDLRKHLEWYLTSWKSPDDPSLGNYSFRVNIDGYPQLTEYNHSDDIVFRFGPWDSVQFNGLSYTAPHSSLKVDPVLNKEEIHYSFTDTGIRLFVRLVLHPHGVAQIMSWNDIKQSWESHTNSKENPCDRYASCGAYGSCNSNKTGEIMCDCLTGYEPKSPDDWKSRDWSGGCVRKTSFSCGNEDKFFTYAHKKFPDTRNSTYDLTMTINGCRSACTNDCSCTAYSSLDYRQNGDGCMLWFNELTDIRDYYGPGLDLYLKVSASESEASSRTKRSRLKLIVFPLLAATLAILLGLFLRYVCWKRTLREKGTVKLTVSVSENKREDLDLPLFDFITIAKATDHFSFKNKLGEGGFGAVYKGILEDNQEIAVKRLSKESRQGLDEFKTEVSVIAKLQHRNLVRLLGCCIGEGEMLLIYEYMPNKSLDSILFDQELSKMLDWPTRYNIIKGIARGLLYLHQDSRLRIVHRDLKASNVLLDHEMNPRISDFGLAKSFTGSETEANTTRVVGTFGYMSPEYALDGTFSVKSDVYSFGVLVLEIISGEKMRRFYHSDNSLNLLSYAWTLYEDGNLSELIDKKIVEAHNEFEAFRAIQIGLLCVNTYPKDRPSMSYVVSMMSSETQLPRPMQPGANNCLGRRSMSDLSASTSTLNSLSVSSLGPRD